MRKNGPTLPHLPAVLLADSLGRRRRGVCTAPMVGTGGHLVQIGIGPIAAGIAAFATSFVAYMCLTLDSGPADAGLRAEPRDVAGSRMMQPKFADLGGATSGSAARGGDGARLASTFASLGGNEPEYTSRQPDHRPGAAAAQPSFGERFSIHQSTRPS